MPPARFRYFVPELDDKIAKDGQQGLLLRPVDPTKLVEHAGYVRGLQAAKTLFEEIGRHNEKDEDQD